MPTIDNLIYTLVSSNNTAIVAGYETSLSSITIPNKVTSNNTEYLVTSINSSAFKNNTTLSTITIGDNITSIGNEAFNGCTSLTNITFGTSITTIGSEVFKDCALSSVTIPNTITTIGSGAFNKCTKMTSVTFSSTAKITTIDADTFDGCSTLSSITIPSSVTSIGNNAFRSCLALTSLVIPNTVTSIGTSLFENCRTITTITIGNSVTSIPNYMCKNCWALTTFTFGSAINSIGIEAFNTCSSLTNITLPNTIITIGSGTFTTCSSLISVTIGNSVTSISDSMFKDCSKLLTITIGSSVVTIYDNAFNGCSSLTNITLPSSVTSIGKASFLNCATLTSITIPTSITSLGEASFSGCSSLTSLKIPNSVTSIGNGAFDSCSKLSYVVIGSGLNTLGMGVFANIGSTLTSVYFLGDLPSSDIDDTVFINDTNVVLYYVSGTSGWSSSVAGKTAYLAPTITSVSTSSIIISADTSLTSAYVYTSTNSGVTWTSNQLSISNGVGTLSTSIASGSYVSTIGNYFDITSYTNYNKLVPITCTIESDRTTFYAGQTATITFKMSTATTKFSSSVIVLNYGTLSTPSTNDNETYTATFTPSINTSEGGTILVSGTSSDSTTSFSSTALSLSILTTKTYVTISSSSASIKSSNSTTITFNMTASVSSFTSSNLTISSGSIGTISVTNGSNSKTHTAKYTAPSSFTGATISIASTNSSYASNTLTIVSSSSSKSTKKAPYKGALVFYVDSDGNMLENSPTAVTDENGEFIIASEIEGPPPVDFSEEPLKVTGGTNILTGQSITYWYAKAGTVTMTPITNLLFYCSLDGSLTNADIIAGVGISDTGINFSNYDDYAILTDTTKDKSTDEYKDALIANNLGNAIDIFATIGSYFLYAINGTNLNTEYDAMMRSIANISTSREDQANPPVIHNDFAELFGTDIDECSAIITDRMRNEITNAALLDIDSATNKTYAELFAKAMAQEMAGIMTTVMASKTFSDTQDYELIGYNVNPYIYQLVSTLKPALSNPANNKNDILAYFTRVLASIFKHVITAQNAIVYNDGAIPGFSNRQTLGNIRSSENAMMRRQVVKSWNTAYANGFVNGVSRVVSPFRAITNSGDFLQRENYVCGGPNQVNASKPGWKGRIGSIISNCDYSGIPSSTCNVKYVPDASDYIKYRKLRANNQNYNDIKGGGY
jgi:BspA type Leucine rich repeat region (6 copies)/Bacterial Ig-like domain